jgi:hypothetical protein
MITVILLGLAALALAGVAGFFSVVGLAEFAAAAAIPIMVFGAVLETSKLIATGFLHYYWGVAPRYLKYTGVFFVGSVMLITMMGIYGFISAAHHNQNTPLEAVEAEIRLLDQQKELQQQNISRNQARLKQMDDMVNGMIGTDKLTNASAIRDRQRKERAEVESTIRVAFGQIEEIEKAKLAKHQSVAAVSAKMGPVTYAANMFNMDTSSAVNIFIIMLMIPFDPFAVWLVIATTFAYERHLQRKEENAERMKIEAEEATRKRQEEQQWEDERERERLELRAEIALKQAEAEHIIHADQTPAPAPVQAPTPVVVQFQAAPQIMQAPVIHHEPEPELNVVHHTPDIEPEIEVAGRPVLEPVLEDVIEEFCDPLEHLEIPVITGVPHINIPQPEVTAEPDIEDIEKEIDNPMETAVGSMVIANEMGTTDHVIIDDHDDMYIEDAVTENIVQIIKRNPNVVDDLKAELRDEVPFPVLRELEKVLIALDMNKQKTVAGTGWLDPRTVRPAKKQPFVTGNEHVEHD